MKASSLPAPQSSAGTVHAEGPVGRVGEILGVGVEVQTEGSGDVVREVAVRRVGALEAPRDGEAADAEQLVDRRDRPVAMDTGCVRLEEVEVRVDGIAGAVSRIHVAGPESDRRSMDGQGAGEDPRAACPGSDEGLSSREARGWVAGEGPGRGSGRVGRRDGRDRRDGRGDDVLTIGATAAPRGQREDGGAEDREGPKLAGVVAEDELHRGSKGRVEVVESGEGAVARTATS